MPSNPMNASARTSMCAVLVSLATLSGAASGCKKSVAASGPAKDDPIVKAATATVTEQPMPHKLALTGSLTANESSDVAANASGAVMATFVERGVFVEKGFVLARIDARTAALSAAEAKAQAEGARTSLQLAKNECERIDKLFKSGAIAGVEYDRQKGVCETAQFSAESADARYQMAQKGIADSAVRAPFAGMIAEKMVSAGEYVQPSTKVARVVAIDPLRLELTVPESSVALLRKGLAVTFHVAAFADTAFHGEIRYLGPSLRATSRDLLVEAVLPNADKKLRPGMFATAEVDLGERPALTMPKTAVRNDGSLRRAFFVVAGRAEERLVKLGEEKGDLVVVEQGAHAGDKVIVPLTPDVIDGARIQ